MELSLPDPISIAADPSRFQELQQESQEIHRFSLNPRLEYSFQKNLHDNFGNLDGSAASILMDSYIQKNRPTLPKFQDGDEYSRIPRIHKYSRNRQPDDNNALF